MKERTQRYDLVDGMIRPVAESEGKEVTKLDIEWKDAKGKLHYKCLSKKAGLSYISFLIEDGAQHIHVTRVS